MCTSPITAFRSVKGRDPVTGKWPLAFDTVKGYSDMPVTIPCGQCIECRLERSRQWAVRCWHEASLHSENCFVTLTYDDAHLPQDGSLNKRDVTLFLKRLRKMFHARTIRFLQCGEYGEVCRDCGLSRQYCRCSVFVPSLGRPHHHMLLFNFDFVDKRPWTIRHGYVYYRSPTLEALWPYGYSSVGQCTFESAAYVARYITKKITGDKLLAAAHYAGRQPEYITMSRRPGIAHDWFEKFSSDVYPLDKCVVRLGITARPPKYYDKIYDLSNHDEFVKIKLKRISAAKKSTNNTPDRLKVRDKISRIKLSKLIRGYETD